MKKIKIVMEKRKLLIVGNGFDLGIGFKTSYKDFMGSPNFPSSGSSGLAQHLVSVKESNLGWVDIEQELSNYSRILGELEKRNMIPDFQEATEEFRSEHEELKNALWSYLRNATSQSPVIKRDNYAKRVLENFGIDHRIVTFNYTDTIERLSRGYYSTQNHNLLHVHGSLEPGDSIVFGVEDSAELPKEHVFLYKAYSPSKKTYEFSQWLKEADKIIFYGYSLGDTDRQYFAKFLQELCKGTGNEKELVFYYYDRDAYDNLNWQLQQFTNNKFSLLEMYNRVQFLDCNES